MLRRACVLGCLLALAGCQRDFSMPNAKALALTPATASVAPFEHVTFEATAGAKPYTFDIATNGSGGATVDAKAGAYVAGPVGPATDVVRVTDASGQSTTARVTVGPKLVVTPTIALAAPGGKVVLAPTGGKPPYQVSAIENGSGGALAADGLTWDVGATGGGIEDLLDVTDAVGASVTVQVHVGEALALVPTRDPTVAPRETLAFVATGGQPPYQFAVSGKGSAVGADAPTIQPSGMYRAGPGGDATDVVAVTDANGQTAEVEVTVTSALTAMLESTALHPGQPVRVIARGGRPPYTFRFADRGDMSDGTIDPASGIYTPGFSYDVADRLEVVDETGVVVSLTPAPVGPIQLPTVWNGTLADVAGNRRSALVGMADLVHPGLSVFSLPPGGAPVQHAYPSRYLDTLSWTSGLVGSSRSLAGDVVGLDGNLSLVALEPGLDGTFQRWVSILPYTAGQVHSFDYVRVGGGDWLFLGVQDGCPGLMSDSWLYDDPVPMTPFCLALPIGPPPAEWRAAFVNTDADWDVVWTTGNEMDVLYGQGYATVEAHALPGTVLPGLRPVVAPLTQWADQTGPEAVVTLVSLPDGTTAATGLYDGSVIPGVRLAAPGDPQPDRLLASVPLRFGTTHFVAWSSQGGGPLVSFARDATGTWKVTGRSDALPPGHFTEGAVGRINGDDANDIALFGVHSDRSVVLWGDGDGGFGARPRVGAVLWPRVADLDGDGVDDLVATSGDDLALLAGHDHGVAWLQKTPAASAGYACLVGDMTGDGHQDLVYDIPGDGLWMLSQDATGQYVTRSRLPLPPGATVYSDTACAAADLGGTASGPDVFVYLSDVQSELDVGVLVRDANGGSIVAAPPACTSGGSGESRYAAPVDANGDGRTDLLAVCENILTGKVDVYLSLSSAPSASPPSFGAWTDIYPYTGQMGDHALVLGTWKGVFAFVRVGQMPGAASELVVGSSTQLFKRTLPYRALGSSLTDLDGDGRLDVVLSDLVGNVHVIMNAADTQSPDVVETQVSGYVVGAARLAPGALPDVLVQSGDDLVILRNDGAGHLQ